MLSKHLNCQARFMSGIRVRAFSVFIFYQFKININNNNNEKKTLIVSIWSFGIRMWDAAKPFTLQKIQP